MERTQTKDRKSPRTRRVMNHVARKPARTGSAAIDHAATLAHHTVDRMASAAAPAAGWMSANAAQFRSRGVALQRSALRAMQQRPFAILGALLALGYAFGRLRR